MKKLIRTIVYIASVLFVTGCGKDEAEDILSNGIFIEVEAPRTNGWSTEENIGTRSHDTKASRQEGEDGLDMEISTQPDVAERSTDGATTRETSLDDNIIFRVVAYKSATAAGISKSNYVEYGDYKLSGSTVQTVKSLIIPAGTYTFICYSYGNANTIPAFTNSSTSVSASNGQNFMTCVKPNITINNLGSKYTLSDIVFKHHCARYRIQAKAQSGKMGNITACSGSVTLPKHKATYTFTNGAFTMQTVTGTADVTWSSPNGMNVNSNYTYLLPQGPVNMTIKLNPTIGGKAFTNKSTTLSGLTFAANKTYRSDVSFTTSEGYIIGRALWANGNLYITEGVVYFYGATEQYVAAAESGAFFRSNIPNPWPDLTSATSPWVDANDPCKKKSPAGNWRFPTMTEFQQLINSGYTVDATQNGIGGFLFGGVLFLPYNGYVQVETTGYWYGGERGFYWSNTSSMVFNGRTYTGAGPEPPIQEIPWNWARGVSYFGIRCVRNI